MDPISIGSAILPGKGVVATAHHLGNKVNGLVSGAGGPHSFSFTNNGALGNAFTMGGKSFSLKPDFISKVPFGRSFSVSQGLQKVGSMGQSPFSPGVSFSGGLDGQMGTAMASSLKSTSLL